MNVSDFRTNLKESLDNAVQGRPVYFTRAGQMFKLEAYRPPEGGTEMTYKVTPQKSVVSRVEKSSASRVKEVSVNKRPSPKILDIPGVEVASKAVCKGTHHMSRKDCGKLGCPWK